MLRDGSQASILAVVARRWLATHVAAAIVLSLLVAGCGGSSAKPQSTLTPFLNAWSRGDWTAMRKLVADPPADFVSVNRKAFAALSVTHATFTAGRVVQTKSGDRARAHLTGHYQLPHVGAFTTRSTVHLVKRDGRWLLSWSTRTIDSRLGPDESLSVQRRWPKRAPILGAGGVPLTSNRDEVVVGVVGERVKHPSAVRRDLILAGATAAQADQSLTAAKAHPTYFEPVFTVSEARFAHLKAAGGPHNVYAVPGTQFELQARRHAITTQLADQLVGAVGPITAEQLKQLGTPYDSTSIVGQRGLEQAQERRLAGTPTTQVNVADSTGAPVVRLATYRGRPGRAVHTGIDARVQRAAEAALAGDTHHVAMVAMRASTGKVLAVVSEPADYGFDQALQGHYPPGSTFKVLTSTALIRKGLSPNSPASCPPTITVDGETFHNAAPDESASTLQQAFTVSCNTAFIGLATQHLQAGDFPATAGLYGLNHTTKIGIPALMASVPKPSDQADLAASAIGQGSVVFSPLGMATVASAIDSGTVRLPRLVQGADDDSVAPTKLPSNVSADLRQMMATVVTSGTAAGTGLPAGTHAKTGTAQYGTRSHLKIDGWLMGYDGDIAFAIVTQNTGGQDGGPVDGPLIAKFLNALGPGA
ncbi:MAG TPA: penicillin-binding transpeptidase domain-containing protein [Solirubrobacteraceae bacterium]|nr:penicillin-binding transpeptidase domain-containing protein [Solirubrobacteraceae bacterium]